MGNVLTESHVINDVRHRIAVTIVFLIGLAVMMVGAVSLDPRLNVFGVPLSPLLFAASGFFVLTFSETRALGARIALLVTPIALMSISLFWTVNSIYGVHKLYNLLACAILAMPLHAVVFRRLGTIGAAKIWVAAMAVLLCVTISYKLRYGLFDRQVLFFLNGPIVFARLMGMAAILSLFIFTGVARYLAISIFSVAVLWTMSKGPILALLATIAMSVSFLMKGRERWRLAIGSLALLICGFAMFGDVIASLNWGRLGALGRILVGDFSSESQDFESTSIRVLMYLETWELIDRHPFGVGIGDWSAAVAENYGLHYPHNLFLELWSEGGLLLGTVAAIPFMYFIFPAPAPIRAVALFLFLAQMVSGDLLDARYLLLWSLLVPLANLAAHQKAGHNWSNVVPVQKVATA
jgi:hypothetical protein